MPHRNAALQNRIFMVITLAFAACERPASQPEFSTVRDSAGIAIVENHFASSGMWRLSETPIIAIEQGLPVEQLPLDPTAVFADANGRIIVGDGNQAGWHAILVYDSAGRFVSKIGGRGRGPGEFGGQLWWAGPYRNDSIVAWDRRGPSMKIFGADGGYARDVPIPQLGRQPPPGTYGFSTGFHGAFDDGTLLTSSEGILDVPPQPGPTSFKHLLLAVEPDGAAHDTITESAMLGQYWDGNSATNLLFAASTAVQPYGNDVLMGNSATYEYQIRDRDGGLKRIVRKQFEPVAVTDADVEAIVQFFLQASVGRSMTEEARAETRQRVEGYPRATAKPAYSSLLVDPAQRVWVERFRWLDPWSLPPDPQPTTWDVFSPEGEWLAEIVAPAGVTLLSVSADRAYGVRIDEEDVRHVVVYRIIRE